MTSSEAFPPPPALPFEAFPPPPALPFEDHAPGIPYPDYTPVDASFALELRAECIEQLSGGDSLRRGESERIEAGRSENNADRVAGCDRVQVQGTLREHTGHGLAVQTAHIETTVGGSFDTHADKEDTVLLAGHMRDAWSAGAAVVAAMSDDLTAGGGVRATAPLDLWVHGLMGLEERAGTCTADAVLAEFCGTLYEREYRTAVHGAGLAVFNGALYHSVRNGFRPLMRVSTGVRNLIAAGGGGAGGDAPPASSQSTSGEAGAEGADAASETLAAGRGVAESPPAGTEAVHLDAPSMLARQADIATVPDDLSELSRSADTAERLGGLRDALRGAEALAQSEAASGLRASEAGATATGSSGGVDGVLDGRTAAMVLDADASARRVGDSSAPETKIALGLLGGGGERARRKPDDFDWMTAYENLKTPLQRHRRQSRRTHPDIAMAYAEALHAVNTRVLEAYADCGGRMEELATRPVDFTKAEFAYGNLDCMIFEARFAGDANRATGIRRVLEDIDQFTYEVSARLAARADEFATLNAAIPALRRVDPHIDTNLVRLWVGFRRQDCESELARLTNNRDLHAVQAAERGLRYFEDVSQELAAGHDPLIVSRREMLLLTESGRTSEAENIAELHAELLDVMTDPSMHRSPSEMGDATYAPVHFLRPDLGLSPIDHGSGRFVHVRSHAVPTPALRPSDPFAPVSVSADIDGLARSILDQLGLDPSDGTRAAGDAESHATVAGATVTARLGAESTSWPRPTGPAQASGTVQFESGLQRGGEQRASSPQGFGDATVGGGGATELRSGLEPVGGTHGQYVSDTPGTHATGEDVRRPHTGATAIALDSAHPLTPSGVDDDLAVERALNAGRLPPRFDASGLIGEWSWLAADTELEGLLESGLLPTRTIDSMIERYQAVEEGRPYTLLIQHLEAMKDGIDRALAAAYGYRASPNRLALVDEILHAGGTGQATAGASVSGLGRVDEVIEAVRTSPAPAPVESATGIRRMKLDAGLRSPADDSWRPARRLHGGGRSSGAT